MSALLGEFRLTVIKCGQSALVALGTSVFFGHRRTVFTALAMLFLAMPSRLQAAGGAYQVDDADIGKAGSCQNEAWLAFASNNSFTGVTSPACVVNPAFPVEITLMYQRSSTEGDWTTAPAAQAKIVPINNDSYALSFSSALIWDSATQSTSSFTNIPLTLKFGKDFRIHLNAGYLYDGRVGVNYPTGGVGFDWDFAPKFSLMGEIFLQQGLLKPEIPVTVNQPRMQLGLRLIPISTVDIDFIYGNNVTGHAGHWFTLGLTVRSE